MNSYELIISLLWAIAAAGITWHVASLAQQITYVTLADGRKERRNLPLFIRMVLPLCKYIIPFFKKDFFKVFAEKVERNLVSAGYDGLLTAYEFLSLRAVLPVVYGPFWCIMITAALRSFPPDSFMQKMSGLFYIVGPLWLFAYPGFWLNRAVATRHNSIQKALPFILDLLTLSVEAGMDFMTALQRCVERRKIDPLGEELIRVIRGIQLGKTRREALREMAERVNLPSLKSVVQALVQADELGVSIGYILRIQSDQIRLRRFEKAEKMANEAPVKMLFPLMFFIFPAVFLILLGPVLFRLIKQGIF